MGKKNHPPVDKKKSDFETQRKESMNKTFKTKRKTNITY